MQGAFAPAPPSAAPAMDPTRELLMAGIMPHELHVNPMTTDLVWQRAGAYVIDQLIVSVVGGLVLGTVASMTVLSTVPMNASPAEATAWMESIGRLNCGFQFVSLALVMAYFICFEAFFGWTPGKKLLGLKVLSTSGEPITFGQAVSRNVALFADTLLGGLVAWYSMSNSRLHQRIGDKWASTVVVRG